MDIAGYLLSCGLLLAVTGDLDERRDVESVCCAKIRGLYDMHSTDVFGQQLAEQWYANHCRGEPIFTGE